MKQSTFDKLYKKLNDEQKQAVDTIDGPVMIIAGPGTGKTYTLTMRIANILKKTDTDPGAILALTFTESGVKAMRERLLEIIGPTAYYVNIHTFHSFCNELIQEFPEIFLISDEAAPLSDLERIQLFREIIEETELDALKPSNSPHYYLHDIIQAIQVLKRESITPKRLRKLISEEEADYHSIEDLINPRTKKPYAKYQKMERNIQKQKELLQIYASYQKKLKEMNRFDFEDMINFVVSKLEHNDQFKLTLQERYLYLLVDEYQDTNTAQNEIVRLLTDTWENPNVFVVGDDEQSIYRFQGASLENVLYFRKLFKHAKVITLTSNYRSSQYILDASRSLIEKNVLKLEDVQKRLKSMVTHENQPIRTASFQTQQFENAFIAEKIQAYIKKGTDPDRIAILVRNNRDVDDIKDMLMRKSIRFEVSTGENILENGDINRLLLLLEVVRDIDRKPSDDIDIFTLLNFEFLQFNELDILKLARFASEKKMNLLDTVLDEDIFNEVALENPKKIIHFMKKLNEWQALTANTTFTKFFEILIKESGFLNWLLSDEYNLSRINTLNTFFTEVKDLNYADHNLNLESFLENIAIMRENRIKIEEAPLETDSEAVKLLTAHKAKGLEFEHVFITKCIDKKWGNVPSREKISLPSNILRNVDPEEKEKNEDERRLFYVALTRAQKSVFITYAEKYTSGGYTREAVPSMFISEIDNSYLKQIDVQTFEKKQSFQQEEQLLLPGSETHEQDETDFLNALLAKFKLSVTSLNTYLQCQYKFKLNNILKTPRAKPIYLSFGSAVHAALEKLFRQYKKKNALPSFSELSSYYNSALEKEILSEEEQMDLQKRGEKILKDYYTKIQTSDIDVLYTEYAFGFRKVMLGDIPLSGKIDRVDWIDKDRREVKVIDYKTGSPKTRGEIEGTTKNSDGNLIRQLLFYKLLSLLDRNFNYTVTEGEFVFLESKPSKSARSETFTYSDEQIEDLKTLIRENMQKIRDLQFERTKEYRHCDNCEYRNHCWPDGIPNP